jgi:signal transduction histidine kinase/ligand-binding sensor domain-containing protein
VIRWIVWPCALLTGCNPANADQPWPGTADKRSYTLDRWTTADGLPQNTVTGLAQTPDGYLWLSTFDGLARFDGVRFTIFDRSNSPGIRNNRFVSLAAARDGTLFAVTEDHVVTIYRSGVFSSHTDLVKPDSIHGDLRLKPGPSGDVIIETIDAEYDWRDGRAVLRTDAKIAGRKVRHYGASGTEWMIEPTAITSSSPDGTRYRHAIELAPHELRFSQEILPFESPNGDLWAMRLPPRTLLRLHHGKVTRFTAADFPGWNGKLNGAMHTAQDGSLGFFLSVNDPTPSTQYWQFDYGTNTFSHSDLGEHFVATVSLTDREGNLWLGTSSGLRRMRRQVIRNISVADGLKSDEVYPLLSTRGAGVLIGSAEGFNRYAPNADEHGENAGQTTRIEELQVRLNPSQPALATSLFQDAEQRIWLGWVGGFGYLQPREAGKELGKIKLLAQASGTDFTEDPQGRLWVATTEGLLRYDHLQLTRRYGIEDGLPSLSAVLTHVDRQQRLWVGTMAGLAVAPLSEVDNVGSGKTFARITAENSPRGYVREVHEDADGVLWFGTYSEGLFRYQNHSFFNYRVEHGLFNNGVFSILEDQGLFWMCSNRGIHRVAKQQLHDLAEGHIHRLSTRVYDSRDGMRSSECNGGRLPAAVKAPDGTLWFATMGGVAIVDPNAEQRNMRAPEVTIESIAIDREPIALSDTVELAPGQSNIALEYTALSLTAASQNRFRYRLQGLDSDWIDAGGRRAVDYSYLPAGTYTFQVIAANADDVWNESGAKLQIVVRPYFYQTVWFFALLGSCTCVLLWLLLHGKVRHARQIAEAKSAFSRQLMASQEKERQRIAAELHDSIGQSLLVIKNRATLAKRQSAAIAQEDQQGPSAAQGVVEKQLDQISAATSQALEEVRSIAYNLRPYHLERLGLRAAIEVLLDKIRESTEISIHARVALFDEAFEKADEVTFYRIIQECMNNIIKHSEAKNVEVRIVQSESAVEVRIADDGRGFVHGKEGPASGFGLVGLAERVRMLGGTFSVQSEPGMGTTVLIRITRMEGSHDS